MMRSTAFCELVDSDGKTYRAKLDVVLNPLHVDEETAAVGDTVQSVQLAPNQRIPDGNYTRLPFQYEPVEKQVHVVGGRMVIGWR